VIAECRRLCGLSWFAAGMAAVRANRHLGLVLRDLDDLPGARAQYDRALQISTDERKRPSTTGLDHRQLEYLRRSAG